MGPPTRGSVQRPRAPADHRPALDGSIAIGAIAVATVNLALWLLTHALVARGYRLKA
jgi:hypothetical protein